MAYSFIIFSLLCAFSNSLSDLFAKKTKKSSIIDIIFLRYSFSLIFVLILNLTIFNVDLKIPTNQSFWKLHFVWIPLEFLAIVFYLKSIKISPLSLVSPLIGLTPLFLIFSAKVFINEKLNNNEILGIILIVLSSIFLIYGENIREEKGILYMTLVAFIYSFTSILVKTLLKFVSPFYFAFHYLFIMSIISFFFWLKEGKKIFEKEVILSSIFFALMIIFNNIALKIGKVSTMIALKRSSILWSVIIGGSLLKERKFLKRVFSSLFMLMGILLISFG